MFRLIPIVAGVLFLAYGLYALHSGRIISTWGRFSYRPNAIYWITTGAFLLLGVMNLIMGLKVRGR
ncbi:MAG: hypothetical protein FJY88_02215 [Candidatus Eisenbacteria bacterium]|nr:hypothetical protein [Candidatus Eisenbacteria bacterium]